MDNHRDYVWERVKGNLSFDSTCFRKTIVSPSGFGHFVNTSHPKSSFGSVSLPNCEYVVGADNVLNIIGTKDVILPGEEILCDYHWQLAVLDEGCVDSLHGKDRAAIELGKLCDCPNCKSARRLHKRFKSSLKKRKQAADDNAPANWPDASAEVLERIHFLYFQAYAAQHSVIGFDADAPKIIEPGDHTFPGSGITEKSFRDLLDKIPVKFVTGGGFVQISANCGFETIIAANYLPNLSYAVSVVTSASAALVAQSTIKLCANESNQLFRGLNCIAISPSPSTSWFSENIIWDSVDGTILFICPTDASSRICAEQGMIAFNRMTNLGCVITNLNRVMNKILRDDSSWKLLTPVRCLTSFRGQWKSFFILVNCKPILPTNVRKLATCLNDSELVSEAATLWNLKTLLRDRLYRLPSPCYPLCTNCPLSSHRGEGVVAAESFSVLGSVLAFDISGGIGLNINDCIVSISGTRYVPHFLFIASENQNSCIVRMSEGNWNHINNDNIVLVTDSVSIETLIKQCRRAVVFCIESNLLNKVSASQNYIFSDLNENSSCFLNCIIQWLRSLKHLYRPKKLDRTSNHGQLWHLFRCCLWENDKQKFDAYTNDISGLMAISSTTLAGNIGDDFFCLLDIVMTYARVDFDFIPWEVSKSSVRCCCSSLIEDLGRQQMNVFAVKAPLLLDQITTAVQLPELFIETPIIFESKSSPGGTVNVTEDEEIVEHAQLNDQVTDLSMKSIWTSILQPMFFNKSKSDHGLVKTDKLLDSATVENRVKHLISGNKKLQVFAEVASTEQFKLSINRWVSYPKKAAELCWYNDIVVSCFGMILNTAVQQGPLGNSCIVLDSHFLESNHPFDVEHDLIKLSRRWKRRISHLNPSALRKVIVLVNVSTESGSLSNHYGVLEISLSEKSITIYDSLMNEHVSAIKHRFIRHVNALMKFFDEKYFKDTSRAWKPVVVCTASPNQGNVIDCGPFAVIMAFYLGLGRSVTEILASFVSLGQIRLFLANLLLQAAMQESEVQDHSNVKMVIDHVQVPTDIRKGMCLTVDDETPDSTKAEKELFKNGFAVLDHQFHFNENHVHECISVFDKAQLKIRPIRNTLEDLNAGDDWNIPGKDAPRSMMNETDMPKHMELEVIQQVKNALRDEHPFSG